MKMSRVSAPRCHQTLSRNQHLVSTRTDRTRRGALFNLGMIPLISIPTVWTISEQPSLSAETTVDTNSTPPPSVNSSQQPPRLKSFIGRDFFFQYNPEVFKVLEDPRDTNPQPGGRIGDKPVKAELVSLDGLSKITVVQSQAAKLKQTLLQITDISQLGTPQEVVRLLLPPTTKVLESSIIVYPQPPKDTGTVMGVIQRDPVQIYRYQVVLPKGQWAEVAVGALLGRILLLGASTDGENWDEKKDALRSVADTFKLLPK